MKLENLVFKLSFIRFKLRIVFLFKSFNKGNDEVTSTMMSLGICSLMQKKRFSMNKLHNLHLFNWYLFTFNNIV